MHIQLTSILLFALVVPFIMTNRLGFSQTPYWLFGLIFLELLLYIVLPIFSLKEVLYKRLKQSLLWIIIFTVLGSAFVSAIVVRHRTHPIYMIHDIVLQQEAAIRFLLDGKNPYATTYFGTFLQQWHYSETEVNPALYHFVMEPFYLLFALPFYFLGNHTIGYFDGRIPLYLLFLALLIMAFRLVKDKEKRSLFVLLLAFNPATVNYLLEGRSDIFMYAFLFAGFYLLHLKKYSIAGISIALSFAVKQSAWPVLPFYIAFLYFKTKSISQTIKLLIPFAVTFGAIVLPFFFWDQKAFLESTIFYLSGSSPHSYPISGYGLGMMLNQFGFIKDVHSYYHFWIWQAIICLPLLGFLISFLRKNPTVGRLVLVYSIFLFVYWYLSRYFNNNHLGFLSTVFITAYFWPDHNTS